MALLPKKASNYGSKSAGKSGSKTPTRGRSSGGAGLPSGGKHVTTKPGQYPPKGRPSKPTRQPDKPGKQPTHVPPSRSHPSGGVSPAPPKGGAPSATTPPPTRTPVAPFLTPAQQKVLNDFDTSYGYNVGALHRTVSDATANTNQGLAAALKTHDVNTNSANQSMAARGLFQSSIRAGDLNDIDSTLTTRNNVLNTNLNRITLDTNSRLDRLGTDWANEHNYYNSLAVANAAAQTPADAPPPAGPESSTVKEHPTGPESKTVTEQRPREHKTVTMQPSGAGKLQSGTGIKDPLSGKNPGGKRYGAMQPAAANLARTRMGVVQ